MPTKLIKIKSLLGLKAQVFSAVKKLDHEFFPFPWTDSSWNGLFSVADRHLLMLAEISNEIKGFVLFEISSADSFAHLLKIIVDPNERTKGVGGELLGTSLNELNYLGIKNFFLEVEENNHGAIALYKSFGFKVIHQKNDFYSNGENALIMTLNV